MLALPDGQTAIGAEAIRRCHGDWGHRSMQTARGVRSGSTDAALIDEALQALLDRHRSAEVDASYAAYDEHPANEPDAWGDLESFRQAAAAS